MKPKLLITIQGGLIQTITADQDCTIGIIDYDEEGMARVTSPDLILHEFTPGQFQTTSKKERRALNYLKRFGFYGKEEAV